MAIVGTAYVEIRALDEKLESDIKNALSRIDQPVIDLKAKLDLKDAFNELEAFKEFASKDPITIKVKVDSKEAIDHIEQLFTTYEENPLDLHTRANTTPVETALEALEEHYNQMDIDANANTAAAEVQLDAAARRRQALLDAVAHTALADLQLDRAAHEREAPINADADTAAAEAQLAFAARRRTAKIDLKLDEDIIKGLKGIGYAISGAIPAEAIKGVFVSIASNFEMLVAKGTVLAGVIGSIGATALNALSNVLVFGSDLGRILGLVNMGPAAFLSFGAAVTVSALAFKGFKDAFTKPKELAKLPIEAQKAVTALKGVGTELRKAVQKPFWEEMGTALQDTVKNILPNLKEGLAGTSRAMAHMATGMLDSFRALNESGGMKTLFEGINAGWENTAKGMKPFMDAMLTLGVVGSKYLPSIGNYLANMAEKFKAFIDTSAATGRIDMWIATAKVNFGLLWGSIKSIHSAFEGLSNIAAEAGGNGLRSFAEGAATVAKIVNSEPFHSRMVTVFEGARRGAEMLGEGIGKIVTVIKNSSTTIGAFLQLSGDAVGKLMSSFSKMFDGTGFGDGMIHALFGLRDAAKAMEPAFRNLGHALGDVGEIAEPMIKATADGLVHLTETVSGVIAGVKDGFIETIPILNKFFQGLLAFLSGPVVQFANFVGDLLKGFAALDPVMRNFILGLGLAAVIVPRIMSAFNGLRDKVKTSMQDSNSAVSKFKAGVSEVVGTVRDFGSAVKSSFDNLKRVPSQLGIVGQMAKQTVAITADAIKNTLVSAATGIGAGFKNLWSDITTGLSKVGDKFTGLRNFITTFAAGLAQGFRQALAPVFEAVQSIRNGWEDMTSNMARKWTTFTLGLGDKLASAKLAVSTTFAALGAVASQKMSDMVSAVKGAVTAIPEQFRQMTSLAGAYMKDGFSKIAAEARGVLNPIRYAMSDMWDGALKSMIPWTSGVKAMFGDTMTYARVRMDQMADHLKNGWVTASTSAKIFGESVVSSVNNVAARVPQVFSKVGDGIKTAWSASADYVTTRTAALREGFANFGAAVAQHFEPVGNALRVTGRAALTAGDNISEGIGKVVVAGGKVAGVGLVKAFDGIMGVLGGPWGLAFTGATLAITAFAQAQADAKQTVKDFSATLDQQTGSVTEATKKIMAEKAFDGLNDGWGDFVRGAVNGAKSVQESLQIIGMSQKTYVDKLTDPKSRDAAVKGWQDITEKIKGGRKPTEEMAAAVGSTVDQLSKLDSDSVAWLRDKAKGAADRLREAEEEVRRVAEATGTSTVAATLLAKNFDILSSSTSSASDKFTALKQNLDLLNKSAIKPSAVSAQREYQQTLSDTSEAIKAIGEKYKVVLPTLFDVQKGFDMTTQAGRDLSSEMEKRGDAILKLGTATLQNALTQGKSASEAQQIALSAMAPAIESLKASLAAMGFAPAQIDAIVQSMGLVPKDLTTAMHLEGTDKVKKDLISVEIARQAFASGNWTAVLAALPDDAKAAIEGATGLAGAFARGDYQAILAALDKTQGGSAAALASMLTVVNGDYNAQLKSINMAQPGADGTAKTLATVTDKDWTAWLKAAYNANPEPAIRSALDALTAAREVVVTARIVKSEADVTGAGDFVKVSGGRYADGGFADSLGRNIKFFANGGFENHVAQIARPGITPRVWAEAETGGEAYIPLALSKRLRSTKILMQVAEMFGFTLMKKFASGGFFEQARPSSVMSQFSGSSAAPTSVSAATAGGTNVNFNVYPSGNVDEEQIGRSAMETLYWKLQNRIQP